MALIVIAPNRIRKVKQSGTNQMVFVFTSIVFNFVKKVLIKKQSYKENCPFYCFVHFN